MRIISGTHKGRKINPPKHLPVRPTTDMSKEALFNILNNRFYFEELKVLDLFAGTGSISYEFASRGATNVTCVDQNLKCIQFINRTSEDFNFSITAIKQDVFSYLEKANDSFDIISADPPYKFTDEQFLEIIERVFKNQLLNANSELIIEHSKHTNLSLHDNYVESRNYGGSVFSFFKQS